MHSLWRISFAITLGLSLRAQAVQTISSIEELRLSTPQLQATANYTVQDMHELLWFSVRQHPNGVEAIDMPKKFLLPPQEGLDVKLPQEVWLRPVFFAALVAGQWLAVSIKLCKEEKGWVEHLTIYETTGHLNRRMKKLLRGQVYTLEHPMTDPDKAASGPIIAQFLLQHLGVAKSFDTVTNMRWDHVRFLQRRRELMTTRVVDVRVMQGNNTDANPEENRVVMRHAATAMML